MTQYRGGFMSWTSLLSVLVGFGIVFGAIIHGTDDPLSFLSMHGFLIVIVGTIANAFMSYQAIYVLRAFQAMWHVVRKPKATREGLNAEIMRLIKWSYVANTRGLAGLEGESKNVSEPLMKYGLELVVTGYRADDVRSMMNTAVESDFEKAVTPVAVLKNMASTAPAFGMVGTLVGMVIMLGSLDFSAEGGMNQIGEGMALALLATLYGVVMARLACLPAADKLKHREEIYRFRNHMMVEGLCLLSEKQSPRFMQDKLNSFLDPSIHFNIDTQIRR